MLIDLPLIHRLEIQRAKQLTEATVKSTQISQERFALDILAGEPGQSHLNGVVVK